ncbi:MAG: circadian clock protein KaiC [Alphaproteobacteria bacterium]
MSRTSGNGKPPESTEQREGAPRSPTGIVGIDSVSGGLPRGRVTLVEGTVGAGKSIFSMQFLANGVSKYDEPGLCVLFEETPEQMRRNMAGFSWSGSLDDIAVIDVGGVIETLPVDGFEIAGLIAQIEAKRDETGVKRIVIDAVDALIGMLPNAASAHRELFRLHRWLAASGMTSIVTAKSDIYRRDPRFVLLDYLSDAVLTLWHERFDGVSSRSLEFQKFRGGACRLDRVPFVIGGSGIDAARQAPDEISVPTGAHRLSTGVAGLDDMLQGGYYAGTATIISGASGTAKTTLAGLFAESVCETGGKVLYLSFDEGAPQIVRDLRAVAIDLEPHIDAGLLELVGLRAGNKSAEQHYVEIMARLDRFQPSAVVLDSCQALEKAGGMQRAVPILQRLLDSIKATGATTVMTSLVESEDPSQEGTPIHVSTIADTWIHLSYRVIGGERNRGLTIIKSRGTAHSNQVRELLLDDDGVTLKDVYVAGGEVLMGTARAEREYLEQLDEDKRDIGFQQQEAELELDQARIEREIEALRRELNRKRQLRETLESGEDQRRHRRKGFFDMVERKRSGGDRGKDEE